MTMRMQGQTGSKHIMRGDLALWGGGYTHG